MPSSQISPDLDALATAEAVAALGEHFSRIGINLIPQPRPDEMKRWSDRFLVSDQSADVASPNQATSTEAVAATSARSKKTVAESIADAARSRLQPVPPSPGPGERSRTPYPERLPVAQRDAALDELRQNVAQCERCPELVRCRTQTVFGEGNRSARFLFFGEGPGADEDRTGQPFVGRSGQLLTKMIEACTLSRDEVYIANTVKCRPPDNRNPKEDEIANCREYFEHQFELIQPEYIICLGAVAARTLLQTKLSIGRLRQRIHPYRGSKVVVSYHPAYLLRNPDAKKAAWADLQMMMADAGLRRRG